MTYKKLRILKSIARNTTTFSTGAMISGIVLKSTTLYFLVPLFVVALISTIILARKTGGSIW